jgi:hypothetical protein
MTNKQKILNKIASRIRNEKPVRSLFIRSVHLGAIAACITLLGISIILVGLFFFDLAEKNAINGFLNQNIYTPANFLFEYLILALILILIFVYLYRTFDWPLVKERAAILSIGILTSVIVGCGIAYGAEHIFFIREGLYTVKDAYVTHAPMRKDQIATTHALLQSSNIVIGTVSKIVETNEETTVSLRRKNGDVLYVMQESVTAEKLRVGEKIAIHVDPDGKTITKLKILK